MEDLLISGASAIAFLVATIATVLHDRNSPTTHRLEETHLHTPVAHRP